MTQNDITGLIVTYAYAFSLLIVATLIQKWRGYPAEFTRKIVHIGAGMAIFPIIFIFDNWYWGIVPTGTFIFFNYLSYRFRLIKAMDLAGDTMGTVYFAFSITLLLAIFWSQNLEWVAVAGTMAMTWGDAFASIIGRGWGKNHYFIGKHRRSLEGSAAMFGFTFGAVLPVLIFFPTGLDLLKALTVSLFVALIATILEAFSLIGLDNIFVPIGASLTTYALVFWNVSFVMLLLGLAISSLIGYVAYQRKSLSFSGVLGAIITGTTIFGFGGWIPGLTLIAFFIYGTVLSKYKERVKLEKAGDKFDKGSRRDIGQALANGGLGAILIVLYFLYPDQIWLFAAFVGAMATVNADTWATEIGVLSSSTPRLIINGKKVTPGTSGGITLLGTLATALGGLVIGLTVWGLFGVWAIFERGISWLSLWWLLPIGLVGGLAGSLFDSFLGATVQAMYLNPETGKETEKKVAKNGVKNRFLRGWQFMNNDLVNFLSSIFGAAIAALLALPLI
jgi:uncharacterized protein (TIGR00297 family)